ncbi:hypothetical protein E8E91_24015 [Pseudomonas sp. BN515]|nr:hypothetical protein [Pseudomonas sp. BN515]
MSSARKVAERRPGKAKVGEEAELTTVNEHSEPSFNDAWPSAGSFRPTQATTRLRPKALPSYRARSACSYSS